MRKTATLVRSPFSDRFEQTAKPPIAVEIPDTILASSMEGYDQGQAISLDKLDAMWEMATLPPPVHDEGFTPKLAIDIIQLTRDVLKVALLEVRRLRETLLHEQEGHDAHMQGHLPLTGIPFATPDEMHAALTARFKERVDAGFTARQFEGDGGMWTIFSQDERAVAFAPDRDSAVRLVHLLANIPPPTELSGAPEPEPVVPTPPILPGEGGTPPEKDDDDSDEDEPNGVEGEEDEEPEENEPEPPIPQNPRGEQS